MMSILNILVLVGCNSFQVVDNVYGPMGGQFIEVASDMKHIGNPDGYSQGTCVTECPSVVLPNTKTRADMFAKSVDGKLAEVSVFERRMLVGSFQWRPVHGQMVEFGNKSYAEIYWSSAGTQEDAYINNYMIYLKNNGYNLDIPGVVGRILIRNVNSTSQMILFYGCRSDMLPKDIQGDFEKETQFLRDAFEKRFTVVGS